MLDGGTKILLLFLLCLPYKFLGFEFGNTITVIVIGMYLLIKNINVKRSKMLWVLSSLAIFSAIHTIIFNKTIAGGIGTGIYISYLILYLFKEDMVARFDKKDIFKWIVNINSIGGVLFILLEKVYNGGRLSGNVGYANTYALILFISVYLNSFEEASFNNNLKSIILYVGIFFTGSRTTLILAILFIVIELILNKKEFSSHRVLDLLCGCILYVIVRSSFIAVVFLAPFIYLILHKVYSIKKVNFVIGGIGLISLVLWLSMSLNTFDRLKNISLTNGSLQERLIMFEDVIKNVFDSPMGFGVGIYKYDIQANSSAFYTGEYVHNSILQSTYDLGIIGGIFLVGIFVYTIVNLYKESKVSRKFIVVLFIILHSMVNFDFSFSVVIFLFFLISDVKREENKIEDMKRLDVNKGFKYGLAIFIVALCLVSLYEVKLVIAGYSLRNQDYQKAIDITKNLDSKLDYRVNAILGKGYLEKYADLSEVESLQEAVKALKNTYENDFNSRRGLVYSYNELNNTDVAIVEAKNIISKVKYCELDYEYLTKISEDEDTKKWIESTKSNFRKKINSKARYLKNQMK